MNKDTLKKRADEDTNEAMAFKRVFESDDGKIVKEKLENYGNSIRRKLSTLQNTDAQVMAANWLVAVDAILSLIDQEVYVANNQKEGKTYE